MAYLVKFRPGVSLVLTVIFVSAFMLVIASLAEVQLKTHRAANARHNQEIASMLAQSAVETARFMAVTGGTGANSDDLTADVKAAMQDVLIDSAVAMGLSPEYCNDVDGVAANGAQPCVEFVVKGRADATVTLEGASYISVPGRGTGSGSSNCDRLTVEQLRDAGNACNWNRIRVGQSVEIPLYYRDGQGHIVKPDFRRGAFKLRVRAPCRPLDVQGRPELSTHVYPEECGVEGRVVLFPRATQIRDPFLHRKKDRILINWLITNSTGEKVLIPLNNPVDQDFRAEPRNGGEGSDKRLGNTEASAGRLNAAADLPGNNFALHNFSVLEKIYRGRTIGINLDRPTIEDFVVNPNIPDPILKLSLVGQPRRDKNDPFVQANIRDPNDDTAFFNNRLFDVPFLEYQLLVSEPIADQKSDLVGVSRVRGVERRIRASYEPAPTLGGFVLENL